MIEAAVEYQSATLLELVNAGAHLNLQNQVRYTVIVNTALHHVSFLAKLKRYPFSILSCKATQMYPFVNARASALMS